jgi:hypothetical protein
MLPAAPTDARRGAHRTGCSSRKVGWVVVAVAIVIALRAPFAALPLGVDEGGLAYVASQWEAGTGWLYGPHWVDRPPLLLAMFRLAVPGAELGIRALGTVAAVAVVVLAGATARALAGDRAARVAAILAARSSGRSRCRPRTRRPSCWRRRRPSRGSRASRKRTARVSTAG